MTPGEVAYEAYRKYSGGKSLVSGQEIPVFAALPDPIKKAWEAAAQAVMADHYAIPHNTASEFFRE